jgi:hypothetical protein
MTHESPEQHAKPEALSRRGMLRYGAFAAAAAAGAAGSAALATPASAATGDPIGVDGTVSGTAVTKITGSSVDVTASNADAGNGVQRAAIVGRASAAQGTGVVGIGAGTQGAGLVGLNSAGPQLQLGVNTGANLPDPASLQPGSIFNHGGALYQVVADPTGKFWIGLGGTPSLQLRMLPLPVRVYASTKDTTRGAAKIARGEARRIDVLRTVGSDPNRDVSGVPPTAQAVVGTIQLGDTEQTTGYLTVASGDIPLPAGYSTAVWSSAGFGGVTGFTSSLGVGSATYGTMTVVCQSANSAAKTHFYVDIIGYYEYDILVGGTPKTLALHQAGNAAQLRNRPAKR